MKIGYLRSLAFAATTLCIVTPSLSLAADGFDPKCAYWVKSKSDLELDGGPTYPKAIPFRMPVYQDGTTLRILKSPGNQLIIYYDSQVLIRQINSSGDNSATVSVREICPWRWPG